MTDILNRLHVQCASDLHDDFVRSLFSEAAAEIERLRRNADRDGREASTERYVTIVRDYIKARDEYEAATRPLNSHAQPRVLPHGDPRVLSYRNARATLNENFKVSS